MKKAKHAYHGRSGRIRTRRWKRQKKRKGDPAERIKSEHGRFLRKQGSSGGKGGWT